MTSCLAVGTYEGRLFGWDVSAAASSDESSDKASLTFALSYALAAHEGPVRCVAVDSGGKFFVTGGADETIRSVADVKYDNMHLIAATLRLFAHRIYNLKRKREVGVLLEHTGEAVRRLSPM